MTSTHPADADLHTMAVRARAFGDVETDRNRQWVTASVVQVGDSVDIRVAGPRSPRVGGGVVKTVRPRWFGTFAFTFVDGTAATVKSERSRLWHSTAAQAEHMAELTAVQS